MPKEHEHIVLTSDVRGDKGEKLMAGDVGTIVHVHPGEEAYVVEFTALDDHTVAIATVFRSQMRNVTSRDLLHARTVESAV